MIVVCYDVSLVSSSDAKRLRRVAKTCEAYGIRVQNSVFEVSVPTAELIAFKDRLLRTIDPARDSLRLYTVLGACETFGQSGPPLDGSNWVL